MVGIDQVPPSKKPTPSDWLDLIASKARALREAGVQAFTVDGVTVQLAPHFDVPDLDERPDKPAPEPTDPLDDPTTFGLKPGSRPPGRRWVDEGQS